MSPQGSDARRRNGDTGGPEDLWPWHKPPLRRSSPDTLPNRRIPMQTTPADSNDRHTATPAPEREATPLKPIAAAQADRTGAARENRHGSAAAGKTGTHPVRTGRRPAGATPKLKPRWDVHFQVFGNWAGGFAGCLSALDYRMVRQRRLNSSLRLARSPRKLLTLSRTRALVPRHKFPVASSLAQPETASSAVKRLSGKLTAPEVSTYAKWRRSPGEGWRLSPLPQPSH